MAGLVQAIYAFPRFRLQQRSPINWRKVRIFSPIATTTSA